MNTAATHCPFSLCVVRLNKWEIKSPFHSVSLHLSCFFCEHDWLGGWNFKHFSRWGSPVCHAVGHFFSYLWDNCEIVDKILFVSIITATDWTLLENLWNTVLGCPQPKFVPFDECLLFCWSLVTSWLHVLMYKNQFCSSPCAHPVCVQGFPHPLLFITYSFISQKCFLFWCPGYMLVGI